MITQLAIASLRRDPRGFLAPFLLMVVAGVLTSLAVHALWSAVTPSGIAAVQDAPPGTTGALVSVAIVALLLGVGVPTCLSVAMVSALAVKSSQDIYATWRLAGVSPRQVRRAAYQRTIITALLAGIVGYLLSFPFIQSALALFISSTDVPISLSASLGPIPAVISVGLIVLFATIAASKPARRASRIRPIVLFQERVEVPTRSRWRWIIAVLVLVGAAGLGLAVIAAPDPNVGSMMTIFLGFALVLLLWLLAPAIMAPFVKLWTTPFDKAMSPSWFLARRYAIAQLAATNATITPLAVGMSILGVYFSALATWQQAVGPDVSSSNNVLQGVVLFGPGAILAGMASLVTLFTVNRSRARHIGVLRSTGASRRVLGRVALLEALIYSVSALLLALAITAVTTLIYGLSMVMAGLRFAFAFDAVTLLAAFIIGFVAIYISLRIPTARAVRLNIGQALQAP